MFEITLSGPRKNALSTEMMIFIQEKLQEAAGQPVLLTGDKDTFSAGLDLKEVASLDTQGMAAYLRRFENLAVALYTYPAPTVALVNGHAIAGGCILVLCCDHRVASLDRSIKIGLNEVALGLQFPPRVLSLVRRRLPVQHVEQIVLGADLYDPGLACELGLIDELAADAPTVARVRLSALAAHPPEAYAAAKAALRGKLDVSPEEERYFESVILPSWTSPELKERLSKALERQPPRSLRHIRAPVILSPEEN